MKKFETGDKVSFINEKQDGVITKQLSNGNYMVEIEDGFALETTASELVKIVGTQKKITTPAKPDATLQFIEVPIVELRTVLSGLTEAVSLVLIPADANQVLTGSVKYYLVNQSKYDVLYSFSNKMHRKLNGVSSGKLLTDSEIVIGELTRNKLMDSECLHIQLLFHQNNEFYPMSTLTKEIAIAYPDLNEVNKTIKGALAFSKLTTLISFAERVEEDLSELVKKFNADQPQEEKRNQAQTHYKSKEKFEFYNLSPGNVEVDLHIEELVEDAAGMNNTEMLQVQLRHFQQSLDQALLKKANRITFIHGVGNGRLKNAIRDEISHIAHLSYRDAPYEKYGAGATEVRLK